jgi:glycolate oxidase FAD binding subunit
MVAGAREGTPADAVMGLVPRLVVEPTTVEEAAEALAACARDRLRLAFVGAGTELELGAPPTGLDVVLRTTRLARVVEHAPADQIVVVEAGLALAELQRRLAAHGQRLALDPPLPDGATLGGVVAANAFGPRRHRFGGARDLVLGMTFVRADGTVARGGGKVVKNVAGFDVPRLLVGSLGTLALVATITLRLHPRPEADATVLLPAVAAADARAVVVALRAAQLEPVAIAALVDGPVEDRRGGPLSMALAVRFEGFGPGVDEQVGRLLALPTGVQHGATRLDADAARTFWARHDAARAAGSLRARIAAPPADLAAVAERALQLLLGALRGGGAVAYPSLGLAFVGGEPIDAPTAERAVADARSAVAARGGSVVLAAAPAEVRALVDPWGTPPAALPLMRRVKDRLDPDHRLAPGRFVGGI